MTKPILCFDFDGVIHSYISGWQGPRTINDLPVPGALEYLVECLDFFEVHIFSSRSRYLGGRRAMKRWLYQHYREQAPSWEKTPVWLRHVVSQYPHSYEWEVAAKRAIKGLLSQIRFPNHKPPAMITLDDRAMTFEGRWPMIHELKAFEPWYRRKGENQELFKDKCMRIPSMEYISVGRGDET